jgi:hypothetical protein
MGRYCKQYKSIVHFFCFLSALGPIHQFKKKMEWCPNPNFGFCYACFWCVMDTRRHKLGRRSICLPVSITCPKCVTIRRQKIYVWAVPRCVWSSQDTSLLGNWAVREKKKQTLNFFVLYAIRTQCWFNILWVLPYSIKYQHSQVF